MARKKIYGNSHAITSLHKAIKVKNFALAASGIRSNIRGTFEKNKESATKASHVSSRTSYAREKQLE